GPLLRNARHQPGRLVPGGRSGQVRRPAGDLRRERGHHRAVRRQPGGPATADERSDRCDRGVPEYADRSVKIDVGSPEEMHALGVALGRAAHPGDVLGLKGDLGAGKTLFVQGLAAGLGVPPEVAVTSPTFTLVHAYEGGRIALHHVDLYRLEEEA